MKSAARLPVRRLAPPSFHPESPVLLSLMEFSSIVNSSHNLSFIFNTLLRTLMAKMLASRGIIFLVREPGTVELVLAKGAMDSCIGRTIPIKRVIRSIKTVQSLSESPFALFLHAMQQRLLVPIFSHNKILGYVSLGTSMQQNPYKKENLDIIRLLVDLSGSAIEKAMMLEQVGDANKKLGQKVQELNTLFDLSKEFSAGIDSATVLKLTSFALLGQMGAKGYSVWLKNDGALSCVAQGMMDCSGLEKTLEVFETLKTPSSVAKLLLVKQFRQAAGILLSRNIAIVVPMIQQQQFHGMLLLRQRMSGVEYSEQDFEFLSSLGNLTILTLENIRLFKQAIEQQRIEEELNIAREIQRGLLPETLPEIPGYEIAALSIPSLEVGGDYYDLIKKTEDTYAIAIGDVSGKGMPAALLMSNIQASLRALLPTSISVAQTTELMNNLTFDNTHGNGKFITFFMGALTVETGEFCFTNAGHNPPFLFHRSGTFQPLKSGGLLLGVLKSTSEYEQETVTLGAGDILVLYTDGITEAMNERHEEFLEKRFLDVLKKNLKSSPQQIIDAVRASLAKHTLHTAQSDDITMVVVKKL